MRPRVSEAAGADDGTTSRMATPQQELPSTPALLRQAGIFAAVAAVAVLLWLLRDLILLLFAAVLFALLLRALADLVQRLTGLPSRGSFALALVAVIGIAAAAAWLFGSEVRAQITQLAQLLPQAWERLREWLATAGWWDDVEEQLALDLNAVGGVVSGLRWAATSFFGLIAVLLMVAVGGIYIAAQPDLYRRGLLGLFPPRSRPRAGETLEACGTALRLWLLGQLVSMVLVGVLTGVGLWLVGLPSAVALGLLAGLAEFVPFFGPVLAAIPGLLVAVVAGPDMVLWVLAVYLVVQQIENNVVTPLVQRRVVRLPPALTLFAAVAMTLLFGLLGLLLATPLTVLLFVLVNKLYVADTLHEPAELPGRDPCHPDERHRRTPQRAATPGQLTIRRFRREAPAHLRRRGRRR
jgi:predicted PurR-regulated permease PerM